MGWKTRGWERAGRRWCVVAARRRRWPERETDWTGRWREMKEGWRRRRRRSGGLGGGGGSGTQVAEMGSKEKSPIQLLLLLLLDEEEDDRMA